MKPVCRSRLQTAVSCFSPKGCGGECYGKSRGKSHTVTSGNEVIVHGPACSFASYMISTEAAVIKVPEDVPLEFLGPFACVQTGAGAVINSLKVPIGSSIAVFGLGTVGMSAIMAAKICGCKTIIGIDVVPQKLDLAKELGATHTINPKNIGKNTRDFLCKYYRRLSIIDEKLF